MLTLPPSVVPIEVVFGAVAGSRTGHAVRGVLGARLGACVGLLLGLNLDRHHGMASSDWSLADQRKI